MTMRQPKSATAAERLTWKEICVRYPDQWVVLVDLDYIDKNGEFRSAVVFGHGPGRKETLRQFDPIQAGYSGFAHYYTGAIRAPISFRLLGL
jgi:hypothetical protein